MRAAWGLALCLLACSTPVEDRECFDHADCADGSRCSTSARCLPLLTCQAGRASQASTQIATNASANFLWALPDGRVLRGWSQSGVAHVSCRSLDLLDDPGAPSAEVGEVGVDLDYPIQRARLRPGRADRVDLVVLGDAEVRLYALDLAAGGCAATLQRRWPRGFDHFADVAYDAAGQPRALFSTGGQLTVAPVEGDPVVLEGVFTREAYSLPCPGAACVARLLVTDSGGATAQVKSLMFAQGQDGRFVLQQTHPLAAGEILAAAADGEGAWAVLAPDGAPGVAELWTVEPSGAWRKVASRTGPAPAQPRAAVSRAPQQDPAVPGRVSWAVVDGDGLHLLSQDGGAALTPIPLATGSGHDFPQLIPVEGGLLAAWVEEATEQAWVRLTCP